MLLLCAKISQAQSVAIVAGIVATLDGVRLANAVVEIAGTSFRTVSRRDGTFRLEVPVGTHRVLARHIGFIQSTVDIALANGETIDTIRFALSASARDLHGITVTGEREKSFTSTITTANIRQLPALGEADVFRALVMLPGVTQPNDVIGRVFLAGGASDEHAITLDEHPLQSPFHVNSVLGAFNVSALERADVIMHHLPSATDGHLSGAISLETKQFAAKPSREVVLSLLSASATVEQPIIGGLDLLVSGRVTYLDRLLRQLVSHSKAGDDILFPGFHDILLRIGREEPSQFHWDLLAFSTRDEWPHQGRTANAVPANWGENLLGVRASYDKREWMFRFRLSNNQAYVHRVDSFSDVNDSIGALQHARIELNQQWLSGSLVVDHQGKNWQINGGVTASTRNHKHQWSGPFVRETFKSDVPPISASLTHQTIIGPYVEATYSSGELWMASFGTHVSVAASGSYLAPRSQAAVQLSRSTRISLAFDRRYQFDAIAGEPQEGSLTQPVFFLRIPRMADVAAISGDWRPSTFSNGVSISAGIATYAKRYRNRAVALPMWTASFDPLASVNAAANTTSDSFPQFIRTSGSTIGATATADLVTSRGIVFHGTYTAQRAQETLHKISQPTTWDVPNQVSVFTAVPLGKRWSFTSAAQLRQGTAVTPVAYRIFTVPTTIAGYGQRYVYGAPRSARLPGYSRVDIGTHYAWHHWNADWSASLHVLNVFARVNGLEYGTVQYFACQSRPDLCVDGGAVRRSLPFLPSIGLELKW
ncbi:MAG: carboxypeptidase regulatory-like domain-containing protein [Gemmatimonadaceae bacterium]